jgi:ferredoxin
MRTILYYYSGTGNSLWIARNLAATLGDSVEIIPMITKNEALISSPAECIGLIFPVHMWGLPLRVLDFVKRLENDPAKYYFAIAVNAGQVAATLIQLNKLLNTRGINLSSGFSVCMPSNYIPWGGAINIDKQEERFADSLTKIKTIAEVVNAQTKRKLEKGPSFQNIFLSALYKIGSRQIPKMDKSFWVDSKCTSCGICAKICPCQNILMRKGIPKWRHHCEQCLACIQWCPDESIQYGKKTPRYKRYHHPEINLKDMLACLPKD